MAKKSARPPLQGGGVGGDSLGEIGKLVTLGGKVPIMELPEVDVTDPVQLVAQAELVRTRAHEIGEWMRLALPKLAAIGKLDREAQELAQPEVAKIEKGVRESLAHSVAAYCRAAWLVFLEFEFSHTPPNHEQVEALLQDLVQEGFLLEDPKGDLELRGKFYRVSDKSGFGDEERAKVRENFKSLLSRVWELVRQERVKKSAKLKAQSGLALDDLVQGKDGTCTLEVPAERRENGDGTPNWLPGGTLTVLVKEGIIYPVDAAGAIERVIEEAKNLGVHLLASSLSRGSPPFLRGLSPDRGRKVQLLWHLVKRAMAAQAQSKAVQEAKENLAADATISSEDFFLRQMPGVALAAFGDTWKSYDVDPTKSGVVIPHLFFLVRREAKDSGFVISLVAIPEHEGIPEFFAGCEGEYKEEGDDYDGLPQPLRRVLKAIKGQHARTQKIGPPEPQEVPDVPAVQ